MLQGSHQLAPVANQLHGLGLGQVACQMVDKGVVKSDTCLACSAALMVVNIIQLNFYDLI